MGMELLPHGTVASRKSQSQHRVKQSPERGGDRVSAPQNLTESSHKHGLILDGSAPRAAAGAAALISGSQRSRTAAQTERTPTAQQAGITAQTCGAGTGAPVTLDTRPARLLCDPLPGDVILALCIQGISPVPMMTPPVTAGR